MSFDPQPRLSNDAVTLRPLAAADRDALHAAAADPETWAGHPTPDRWRREVFDGHFDFLLASGTTLAILDRTSDQMVGCSRYYAAPDRPEDIAIGFTFLDRSRWGGATNFAVKRLMLAHAFASFAVVWFHIGPGNRRSEVATGRLGAVHDHDATLDLTGSGKPATWMCFRLDRAAWQRVLRERGAA